MIRFLATMTLLTALSATSLWAKEPQTLTLAQAPQHVGEEARIELVIKSSRLLESGKFCFLNSEKNFQLKSNFTVAISAAGLAKFAAAGVENPAEHFRNQTIVVTGQVASYKERLQIQVDDPQQIVAVQKLTSPGQKK